MDERCKSHAKACFVVLFYIIYLFNLHIIPIFWVRITYVCNDATE